MRCHRFGLILLVGSLTGCFATDPTINRWATATGMPDVKPPVLYVSSAAPPPSPADAVTFRSLPERTGAAYVKALAEKNKDTDDFSAAIQKPFKDKPESNATDVTKVPRVLLMTVQRESVRPGDRLISTTVEIQPLGFRFSDYSFAATENKVVNIGTVVATRQQGQNIGIAPASGSAVNVGVSAGLSATQSETGTRNVVSNTELSVHVAPDLIQVFRTGADGQDLTGNTLIKLSFRLPSDQTKEYTLVSAHLTGKDGKPQPLDQVKMDTSTISTNPAQDLYVCAKLTFLDRVVTKGAESYDEGRHEVTLTPGVSTWKKYLIAPLEDLETPLWEIRVGPAGLLFDDGVRILPMNFDDFDSAVTFMNYLQRSQKTKLQNGQLYQGTKAVPQAITDFSKLSVARVPTTRANPSNATCPP